MTFSKYRAPAPHRGRQVNTGNYDESQCGPAVEHHVSQNHSDDNSASPYGCNELGLAQDVQYKVCTQKRNKKRRRYKQNA